MEDGQLLQQFEGRISGDEKIKARNNTHIDSILQQALKQSKQEQESLRNQNAGLLDRVSKLEQEKRQRDEISDETTACAKQEQKMIKVPPHADKDGLQRWDTDWTTQRESIETRSDGVEDENDSTIERLIQSVAFLMKTGAGVLSQVATLSDREMENIRVEETDLDNEKDLLNHEVERSSQLLASFAKSAAHANDGRGMILGEKARMQDEKDFLNQEVERYSQLAASMRKDLADATKDRDIIRSEKAGIEHERDFLSQEVERFSQLATSFGEAAAHANKEIDIIRSEKTRVEDRNEFLSQEVKRLSQSIASVRDAAANATESRDATRLQKEQLDAENEKLRNQLSRCRHGSDEWKTYELKLAQSEASLAAKSDQLNQRSDRLDDHERSMRARANVLAEEAVQSVLLATADKRKDLEEYEEKLRTHARKLGENRAGLDTLRRDLRAYSDKLKEKRAKYQIEHSARADELDGREREIKSSLERSEVEWRKYENDMKERKKALAKTHKEKEEKLSIEAAELDQRARQLTHERDWLKSREKDFENKMRVYA